MYNFTQSVQFYTQCMYFTHNLICEFELPDASLRCFVVRQLLLCIYALSSVKFSGLKLWLCKKSDKYEVCIMFSFLRNQKSKHTHLEAISFTPHLQYTTIIVAFSLQSAFDGFSMLGKSHHVFLSQKSKV